MNQANKPFTLNHPARRKVLDCGGWRGTGLTPLLLVSVAGTKAVCALTPHPPHSKCSRDNHGQTGLGAVTKAILCFLLFLVSTHLRADFVSTEFERANKLYEQNKFTDAVATYDYLIADGKVSVAVFFNRGNAFFKQNQIGKAIASYRQAEKMAPRDPEVRANLQFARNQAGSAALKPGRWENWLNRLTVNEWTALAAIAFWSLFALLAVVQWRTELKRTLNKFIFALAGIVFLLAIPLALSIQDFYSSNVAIVTAREAVVRNGPLDESQIAFRAADGAELSVLDSKGDWLQVSDSRRVGWVKRDAVLIFGPSPAKAKS